MNNNKVSKHFKIQIQKLSAQLPYYVNWVVVY